MKFGKKSALCAVLSAIVLSSSIPKLCMNVSADAAITETEAFEQAVALYEHLAEHEVEIPQGLDMQGIDAGMLKSVVLGYMNFDDAEAARQETTISKQDFITVLYKTIVSYNDSYVIYDDEADAILNECYDNAYINEENRIAYAFMMKQGIITAKFGTQPDMPLTKAECEALINTVYDYFAQSVKMNIDGKTIIVGENVETLLNDFGNPNRIDETEYGFDWYVYNYDYGKFFMAGVEADRVCAVYSNSSEFEFNGIKSGDDYILTQEYSKNPSYSFCKDSQGHIDSVMYNPREKHTVDNAAIKRSKSLILLDIINSHRVKNGKNIYIEDSQLSAGTWLSTINAENSNMADGVVTQSGSDIFDIYEKMLAEGSGILSYDTEYTTAVGLSSSTDDEGEVHTSILSDVNSEAERGEVTTVEIPEKDYSLNGVEEVTTPILVSPSQADTFSEGSDVVIELAMQASTEYHVEVFDIENDEYAVNEYIVTDKTEITLPSELFKPGRDYKLSLSSITPDGEALSGEDVLFSYGDTYNSGVKILTPYNAGVTDDDYIAISWESEEYHDFCIDLYNENDELIVNKVVEDTNEVIIRGVDPGKYFLCITARTRGTDVNKAQDSVLFTVLKAEPVINEIILDKEDKYEYVYEDEELGLLYFYDEELVDVEDAKGKTVKKKKIIQKQVKATKGYIQLAKYRSTPSFTTGDPVIMQHTTLTGDNTKGSAIVAEAQKYLGVQYVWGGTTPDGFDCSGLVQYVCNTLGISVNRVAEDQFKNGTPVNKDELQPGDLVFFEQNGYIHHVGIYAGNNMMIHAPRTGDVVKYQSIDTDYYRSEYAGARRVY